MRGFWSVAAKEFLHLRRDPATIVVALLIPVLQLTIFGYAIDFDVRHIRAVAVDLDRSSASASYLAAIQNTQYIQFVRAASDSKAALDLLRRGEVSAGVIVPPGFGREMAAGRKAVARVLVDGSDNTVATRARLAFQLSAGPPKSAVEPRISVLFNPEMRSSNFMVPGLIGVILQIVTVSLTSFSFVREREHGTLEQLMVSPVGRLGLMLGKLTPYAFLALAEMGAVVLAGWLLFGVHIAGSPLLLFALTVPFILAALSMGLAISTIAQNQAQALQLTLLTMLPSILLSGFVFPRDTMPGPIYVVSFAIPVTFFLDILRGIVLRGAGLSDLWTSVAALLALTVMLVSVSALRFRKSVA